ncbi:peptide deformylase [soil metagenome]
MKNSNLTKILRRSQFGNPLLRQKAKELSKNEILSPPIQGLIKNMLYNLENKKYGVGLAAPQIGESIALSVISIKPTPARPELKRQELTIMNPKIVQEYGRRTGMYEGCISGPDLFAEVLRYKRIRLSWLDEKAKKHERDFDGFMAHVLQHEIDHVNGILFVDRVKDTKSYMTISEYKKRVAKNEK